MNLKIVKYNEKYIKLWDEFVDNGVLGTIFHKRSFLNYHPKDRFLDESIMIYNNDELICVLPCCKKGEIVFSHSGASYGGPVFKKKFYKLKYINPLINMIFEYFNNKIEFRIASTIYFNESLSILNYILSKKLTLNLELSWYSKVGENFIENIRNKSNKKKLQKKIKNNSEFLVTNEINDYKKYYNILENMLGKNHNTKPTHTLEEFLLLKEILNNEHKLYLSKKDEIIRAGVFVIKVTKHTWYCFYICRNIEIADSSTDLIYLMYQILKDMEYLNLKYLDYGISTEDGGQHINYGLSEFKENSFGGYSDYRYLFNL
jgi:hypothetical protein